MAVNGPSTEDGLLFPQTEQVLEPGPGHDPMMRPITWSPETGEVSRPVILITHMPPERPVP